MRKVKYKIYELSAQLVASFSDERGGVHSFDLGCIATEKCKSPSSLHEQESTALFFQIMCVLRGNDYAESRNGKLITDLADVIFYMNFEHIFDRRAVQKKYIDRQKKAEAMFRPEGVTLDFGSGAQRYLAFERSASMSRNSRLSFIRADIYDEVRRRIMMDIHVGDCQISKLYAYNGLMLSGGVRIANVEIDRPHRVIVIDNPVQTVRQVNVITVADDGTENAIRRYHREEKKADIEVMSFDGEGLISREYAKTIDKAYCGQHIHTSFQIRMPYVKGMVHQVDFKDFFTSAGTRTITDLWGVSHNVADVDIILTKSMFKGYGWLTDDHKTWDDYWDAFRKYHHALYVTNVSKEKPELSTDLNYQFLTTASVRAEEFRPADLPDGWDHSPEEDGRDWLTKQTELAYYNFCANERFQIDYFLENLSRRELSKDGQEYRLARLLKKNPLLIGEPVFADKLTAAARKILKDYSVGRLIIEGDNRYLSGDLVELMTLMLQPDTVRTKRENVFYSRAMTNNFRDEHGQMTDSVFYAPGAAYSPEAVCTLLRNPHIARNEEIQLSVYRHKDNMRKYYLGHLTDIVMVDAAMLASERLGGADYDGDMIKTISNPVLNACVRRNYQHDLSNSNNIPLLQIPSAQPLRRSADDWHARFEAVSSTFASRVGQICNAALDRSIIAYNENSEAEARQRCREETETLAILVGLEIDSSKSGVKPDLSEYLNRKTVKRTPFLKYKALVEAAEERRAWYEPTHEEKLKKFFRDTDWATIDSNIERLPYLAEQLKRGTPKRKTKPASDEQLFAFTTDARWRKRLDNQTLEAVGALLTDYERCLSRIRACRVPIGTRQKVNDVERILFSRGQDEIYDADELYALFQTLPPERITALLGALQEQGWHLLDEDARQRFLAEWLPSADFMPYYDLLSDFRSGGCRVLIDIVMDIEKENSAGERKQLFRKTDSAAFTSMMRSYADMPFTKDYKEPVAKKCRELLSRIVKLSLAVRYVVALGKRKLLWELLPDQAEKHILEVRHAE